MLVLLALSIVRVSREVILRYNIGKEINILNDQLGDLKDRTAKTEKLISYLKTDEYVEKEARLQLNLSKPGEKQINITDTNAGDNNQPEDDNASNMVKWFNYFFK